MQISVVLNLSVFTAWFWEKEFWWYTWEDEKGEQHYTDRLLQHSGVWQRLWNSKALTTGQSWAFGQDLRKTFLPTSVTHYGAISYSSHTHRLFFWPNYNCFTLNYKLRSAQCSWDRVLHGVTYTVSDKSPFHTLINIWKSPGKDLWHRSWETRH